MDLGERAIAHQARHGKRELFDSPAAFGDDDAAADLREPHGAGCHVAVVDADHDHVVRVVGDRGRESSALQADVGCEAKTDAAARVMPLEDGDLDQVARGVGHEAAVLERRLDHLDAGEQLRRDDAHDADLPGACGNPKRGRVDRRQADRTPHPFGDVQLHEARRRPVLQHLARLE